MNLMKRRRAMIEPWSPSYIKFVDPEVERICIENFSSDGIGVTTEDAAAVTNDQFGTKFKNNTIITSFNELEYFTGLTAIPSEAFRSCTALVSVKVPRNVTSLNNYSVFNSCTALVRVSLPDNLMTMGSYGFYNCRNLTTINIPQSLTTLNGSLFNGCDKLVISELYLPNLSGSFNNNFYGTKIITVTSLGSVTALGKSAFEHQTDLTSINIPSTVKTIGDVCFRYNTSLTTITLPQAVTSLGNDVFTGCTNLTSITILATTPPTLGSNTMGNVPTIYVPAASVSDYQTAWPDYASRIQAIPSNN